MVQMRKLSSKRIYTMRKLIKCILTMMLAVMLACCDFCGTDAKCRLNYTVVYPDTTIVYDVIVSYTYYNENQKIPYVASCNGSNKLFAGTSTVVSTTCPIRLNSYKMIKKGLH